MGISEQEQYPSHYQTLFFFFALWNFAILTAVSLAMLNSSSVVKPVLQVTTTSPRSLLV